ncbi:phosphocholine-specific phospholipase C [Kitasatospora sp. DSM 101779]|uniref:phosphocholine-specific phospholipase C n=1 Tax=Kitasatospora sp. DSM 101779 TaxID=2853165 RepID=UPI0021D8923D|nr:phospholipase C, phosphocholine-specific [Kitasatospora sp. DSM 101779]MCU7824649.1 phospholipase C, phosphocholine-specific [Kitasatospora sp. DSM 101779]
MAELSRRKFMALSASAAAGAAVASTALGGTTRASAAGLSTTGTIADARHIVILMQENRSFDHYFGTLKGVRGFADRSAVQIAGGYSVFNQPNGLGRQYPWQFSATKPAGGADPERLAQCNGDLSHAWSDQHKAWNGGKLDSWVSAKGNVRTLGYLTRADIPFHYALADNWTVNDAYFCSVLSATGPNRTYHWSGMIDPAGTAGGPAYDGGDESGLRWQTYAEALEAAGVTWKVYQNAADNYGDNALAYFTQFSSAPAGSPLAVKGMGSVPKKTGKTPDDIAAAIRADVVAGTLPQVSWIVPDQASSEHPYATPADGAHFVHMVMDALHADPDVFDSTVLLLNYDENDGFFDHVPPPAAPAGTAGEFYNGTNIGLGFRVPLIAISPWTRGGWVSSEVSDHTSVLRFLERWTAAIGRPATCPNISAWRRKVCGDLTGMFDFANPVYGLPALPNTDATIGLAACGPLPNPAPVDNKLPQQEPGTRPARALPYQPNANLDHLEFGSGGVMKVWIAMANPGATGAAHLAAYANAYRSGGPWQYTVDGGGSTSDFFNCGTGFGGGPYDLSVVGPNRFLRRFKGDATKPGKLVSVTASYANAPTTGRLALWFAFANTATAPVTFTVTSTNYRTDGPWTYTVPAGGTASDFFNAVAYNNGWYDFTVTVDSDPTWSQRFTGHLETGAASVSG